MEKMSSAALQHNQKQIKNPNHGFPFPVTGRWKQENSPGCDSNKN